MESVDKRSRIQHAAMQLFQEQGVEATSVNEIVKRANVAKGTFYVYYKDKKELISQILTKQHGCLLNDLLNRSYERSAKQKSSWKAAFVDEMITCYMEDPVLLRTIQKNITSILDTEEHRMLVFQQVERLQEFLDLVRRDHEDARTALNRFMLVLEIIGIVCYNAIYFQHPDNLDALLPELKHTMRNMIESEECNL